MICEKCGKEIPENETICPCCNEAEAISEQPEEVVEITKEIVAESTEETASEPILDPEAMGVPVSTVVRGKRGKVRIISGIVCLVVMAAILVTSFLKPVLLIGNWKVNRTLATGMGTDFEIESTMTYTASGKFTLAETLLNWEELSYPQEQSRFQDDFNCSIEKGNLILDRIPAEGEEETPIDSIVMHCEVTPNRFSYWQGENTPREVYDYQRDGLFYPAMILWMVSAFFAILGVLLLTIPGKKYEVTTYEEAWEDTDEAEDLDELLEEIYEEIEAEDEVSQVTESVEE